MGSISCGWERLVLKWGGRSQFDIRQGGALLRCGRGGLLLVCVWGGDCCFFVGVGWGVLPKMLRGAVTEIEDGRYKVERCFLYSKSEYKTTKKLSINEHKILNIIYDKY